jgi:hypothetical protein
MANNHDGFDVNAPQFLDQLDHSEEFDFSGLNGLLSVHTLNTIYQFDLGNGFVRGGYVGEDWVRGRPNGATFGGSMIMVDRLLVGSHMEFYAENRGTVTTTPVTKISYRKPGDM